MAGAPGEESVLEMGPAGDTTGEQSRGEAWPHPCLDPKQITLEGVGLAPTAEQPHADAMDLDQTDTDAKQQTTADAPPEGQDTEMHIQEQPTVRHVAVRSVLWDDIMVEVPSNATMIEFRKAIESQSGGKLREDMLPELVYDGILLPADNTSIEEAGLAVENAVVGFLALDVYALATSAGLESEPAPMKPKLRDRRIKIYVPCAPRVLTDAPALDDATPQPAHSDAVRKPQIAPDAQAPAPQSTPAIPQSVLSKQASQTASVEVAGASPQTPSLQKPQEAATESELRPIPKSAGPQTNEDAALSGSVPGMIDSSTQIEPGELFYPLLVLAALPPHLLKYSIGGGPEAAGGPSAEESEPPESVMPAEGGHAAEEVQAPENVAVTREGSPEAEPIQPTGGTVTAEGGAEAMETQPPETAARAEGCAEAMEIQPPENAATIQETAGGGSDAETTGTPQEALLMHENPEGGAERVEIQAPGVSSTAPIVQSDVAPSEDAALVPYLPPPPVIYGPGGREMVPVDTSRRRKSRASEETEEERQGRLRRARRLFSVGEVEALVTAVERLGPGRWREVKERVFSHADHRTYGDLKDKWKTLVKTAQIAPQQRRGVEIPEELLERVTRAHAYWTAQAAKDERIADLDVEPHVHYMRPLLLQNGAHSEHHVGPPQPTAHDQAPQYEAYHNQATHLQQGHPAQRLHQGEALAEAQTEGMRQDGQAEDTVHMQYAEQASGYADGHSQQWQQHLQANYQQQPQNQEYQQQMAYEHQQQNQEHYQGGQDSAPNLQPSQYASYEARTEKMEVGGQDVNRDERSYHHEGVQQGYVAQREATDVEYLMGDQAEQRQYEEGQQEGNPQRNEQAAVDVPATGQRHEQHAEAE